MEDKANSSKFREWIKKHRIALIVCAVILAGTVSCGIVFKDTIFSVNNPENIPSKIETRMMKYLRIEDEERLPQDALDKFFQSENLSKNSQEFAEFTNLFVQKMNTLYSKDLDTSYFLKVDDLKYGGTVGANKFGYFDGRVEEEPYLYFYFFVEPSGSFESDGIRLTFSYYLDGRIEKNIGYYEGTEYYHIKNYNNEYYTKNDGTKQFPGNAIQHPIN